MAEVIHTRCEDITGKKFNMLTVQSLSAIRVHKSTTWLCKCDCGGEKLVSDYHLKKGMVRSCGCLVTYNLEKFIREAIKVHGSFYDYSKSKYTGHQEFLDINCPLHGKFSQRAAIHLSGSGCQVCAGIRMGAAHAMTVEEFDSLAKAKRDDFTYNLSEYKNVTTRMNFICKTHGTTHRQKPTAYLNGDVSCMACRGRIHSKESFIAKAREIHGDRYDYSIGVYDGTKKNYTMICSLGHIFNQTPHNHTAGKHGCPSCGPCGFDARKDSWIYVLSSGNISKLGITNRSAEIRAKSISKSSGIGFKVVKYYKLDGQFCSDLETKLLRQYRATHKNPIDYFQGSSECFLDLPCSVVIEDIDSGILEYSKKFEVNNKEI
jgi:hypothetical protein